MEWEELPKALAEIARVLKPNSEVCVVGPCIEKAIQLNQPQWLLDQIIARPSDDVGICHAWTPTTLMTRIALERGGLLDVREIPLNDTLRPLWPNTVGEPLGAWQCSFIARTP